MNEYELSDYGIFSDAIGSTNAYSNTINQASEAIKKGQTILSDQSIFMGPAQESCLNHLTKYNTNFTDYVNNMTKISSYLTDTAIAYKNGDQSASNMVLGTSTSSATGVDGTPISSVEIPEDIKQKNYSVTCYGEGGWYLGGGDEATSISSRTNQYKVHQSWLSDGARYKNGVAVMNVNGQDRYLVAVAPTFGKVGDTINVNLRNGQTVPCIIADAKSTHDANYVTYGHSHKDGSIGILELEVDRIKWRQTGRPSTDTWNLDWDTTSDIRSIDNYGSSL